MGTFLKYGKHSSTLFAGEPREEKPKAEHAPYITVTSGMSGYFAVCVHWSLLDDNDPESGFWEPFDTYPERRGNFQQAVDDAKKWAESEGLEYK